MPAHAIEERALILAPIGQDGAVTAGLFEAEGIAALVCASPTECLVQLERGAGVVLLTEEALEMAGALGLLEYLEAQPAWSELPLIILTSGGESRRAKLLDLAASAAGNVTLLERPMSRATLLRSVQVALRSRRRQYQVRDLIAERERAQAALERVTTLLAEGQKVAHVGSFEYLAATGETIWSEEEFRIYGLEPGSRSPSYAELMKGHFHPEDAARLDQEFTKALRSRSRFEVENRIVRPDGAVRYVYNVAQPYLDEQGKLLKYIGATLDITERKQAEMALRGSEQRLALALEGGRMGMWEWDLRTNRSVWNAREYELLGLPCGNGEPTGTLFLDHVHPEDYAVVEQSLKEAMDKREDWRHEFRIIRPDGNVRWLVGAGRLIVGRDGKPERLVGVNYDITERKEFQVELERMVAERTAKLQELVGELEHFSYTITHDMRAPLRAMRGLAEIISHMEEDGTPAVRRKFIDQIITAAERMDGLITDALSYSKAVRQELPLAPVDVRRLVQGMLDTYPEFQSARADIRLEGDLPLVMGNEAGLTQCFSNLLGNAIKFARPGQRPQIRIGSEPRGDWVRLWIEDKGVGISPAMLPRVFDMFSRGANPAAGTGIGLALVRKVVDRMDGRVGVESQPGQGSRFWVELRSGDVRRARPPEP